MLRSIHLYNVCVCVCVYRFSWAMLTFSICVSHGLKFILPRIFNIVYCIFGTTQTSVVYIHMMRSYEPHTIFSRNIFDTSLYSIQHCLYTKCFLQQTTTTTKTKRNERNTQKNISSGVFVIMSEQQKVPFFLQPVSNSSLHMFLCAVFTWTVRSHCFYAVYHLQTELPAKGVFFFRIPTEILEMFSALS